MTVYETPGLSGLEIWRGVAGGVPLFQHQGREAAYFDELREFLLRLHDGVATAGDTRETKSLRRAAGFERVVFCGGSALHPALETALSAQALPFTVEIDKGGPFASWRGALRIFASQGWQRGIALDLGQMQLKVMTAGLRVILPRDRALLPFGAQAIEPELGRARLRALIQAGLSQAAEGKSVPAETPDGVVLALPVALGRDGMAEPATYPGLFGPLEPIFSGLFACPWVVVNDAVLAGVGFPPEAEGKTLVVTLGFGIGCALWST